MSATDIRAVLYDFDGTLADTTELVMACYRLTMQKHLGEVPPVEEWLRPQKRFAHLLRPEHAGLVAEIQRRVDADWEDLLHRCQGGELP